jgi:hypothetical protein
MISFHKTICLIFFALANGFYSETLAQSFSTEIFPGGPGPDYKFSMNAKDTNFACYYSSGQDILKGVGYVSDFLSRYSRSGSITKKVSLSSPDFPKPLPAVSFVLLENKIIAFTILGNTDKTLSVYACEIKPITFEQVNSPVFVFKYSSKSWSLLGGRLPSIIVSENNKCVLVASFGKDDLNPTLLHGVLLNAKLEKMWDKTFTSDVDLQAMLLMQIRLGDDGRLIMAEFSGKLTETTMEIVNLSKSSFHVFTTEEESVKIFDHVLSLDTVNPLNIRTGFLTDGTLICTGLYGKENNIVSRGVYYISYGPHSVVPLIKKATSFPAVFIQEAMEEQAGVLKGRSDKGLNNVKLEKMVIGNGSVVILAEHEYMGGDFSPGFHLQDIVAISFSSGGEVNWFKRINKSQVLEDSDSNFCSFSAFESNGKIFVFYNDNEKNGDDPSDPNPGTFKNPKTGNLVCVSINEKGIMQKTLIIGFNKANIPQPLFMDQVSKNSFICPAVSFGMDQERSVLRINCQ